MTAVKAPPLPELVDRIDRADSDGLLDDGEAVRLLRHLAANEGDGVSIARPALRRAVVRRAERAALVAQPAAFLAERARMELA